MRWENQTNVSVSSRMWVFRDGKWHKCNEKNKNPRETSCLANSRALWAPECGCSHTKLPSRKSDNTFAYVSLLMRSLWHVAQPLSAFGDTPRKMTVWFIPKILACFWHWQRGFQFVFCQCQWNRSRQYESKKGLTAQFHILFHPKHKIWTPVPLSAHVVLLRDHTRAEKMPKKTPF